MKKHFTLLFLLIAILAKTYGLSYTITFTGSGASTTITNVIVQNLTKGITVTVPSGNVLNLTDATAVEQISASDEFIRVYPNLAEAKSTLSFFAKQSGNTQIDAFAIDGKKITGITANLPTGVNSFKLSLPSGSFVVHVSGKDYNYTIKFLNQSEGINKPEIVYNGAEKLSLTNKQKSKSSALGATTMAYTVGDQLLYKAVSGNYSTIVTDKPTGSKTTNFVFVDCTDSDGNHYSVVSIGTQTWMAENLKTTKYNDGTAIPLISDSLRWGVYQTAAYCWYKNNVSIYKTYGALYSWGTVGTGKLAPTSWHVPTKTEWTTLGDYVSANLGSSGSLAKAMAATTNWLATTTKGAPGNNLTLNNTFGFTGLPVGLCSNGHFSLFGVRAYWWSSSTTNSFSYYSSILDDSPYDTFVNFTFQSSGLSVRCIKD